MLGGPSVRVSGCDPLRFPPGEIVVLPGGDAHILENGAPTDLVDSSVLLPEILKGSVLFERCGGGGPVSRFVCGYIGCERQAAKLFLAGLPPVFEVAIRGDIAGAWIESAILHLASESEASRPAPGAAAAAPVRN